MPKKLIFTEKDLSVPVLSERHFTDKFGYKIGKTLDYFLGNFVKKINVLESSNLESLPLIFKETTMF